MESSASDEVTWVLGVSVGTAVGMGLLESLPLMSAFRRGHVGSGGGDAN